MSGKTLVETYNMIFVNNYNEFCSFAKNDTDSIHDNYLKILKRFENITQFTASTINEIHNKIYAYIKSTIYNTYLTKQRLKKNNISIESVHNELELILLENEMFNEDLKTYEQQLEYLTIKLFEYIKRYAETEQYVFRVYYLYDEKHRITYKELSKITGYSISKCCSIIQAIKSDCRANLINYINANDDDNG